MVSLIVTLAILIGLTLLIELACWKLFRKKMLLFRFPSPQDPKQSHTFWLDRMRRVTIAHAVFVVTFICIFCISLW